MATLKTDQYQLSARNGTQALVSGSQWLSQTFTPSVTGDLDKVHLAIGKFNTPTDDFIVSIRATAAGVPTGADLASETIGHASIDPASVGSLTVTFSSPPALVSGTVYAIIVRSPTAGGGNAYSWQFSHVITSGTPNYYTGGQLNISTNSGATWVDPRTADCAFVTEMSVVTASPAIDVKIFGDDNQGPSVDNASTEYAQTFEPTISADLKKVAIAITRFSGQTGGTVTVEIQDTDGADKPDGNVLASETIADASISEFDDQNDISIQEVTFATPASLTSGTRYAVVLKFPDAGGAGHYRIAASVSVDQYADGERLKSLDSGTSWTATGDDLLLGTFMLEPTVTTQTIDADAIVQIEQEQTINSNTFVGQETVQGINADANVGATTQQVLLANAFVGQETLQTINALAHILAETEQTINADATVLAMPFVLLTSNANISGTTTQSISAQTSIFIEISQTIDSDAVVVINSPELKLFASTAPTVEVGTPTNPLSFTGVIAGQVNDHPDNPFFLFNDKGGSLNSVDARQVTITVVSFNIQNEVMGFSNGSASQAFVTAFTPVIDDDPVNHPIIVKVNGVVWTRVDDITVVGALDEFYEFDAVTGTVTFGDGISGKIPPNTNTIEITYGPADVQHGDDVEQSLWFGVQSAGIVGNPVTVDLERQVSTGVTTVQVGHQNVLSVAGVFLATDPNGFGTNFFTGGSIDTLAGILTLGTALPAAETSVVVNYTYQILDDAEPDTTQVGEDVVHEFSNSIPSNNAKQLFFSLTPPLSASPSGPMDIQFTIRLTFNA